MSTHFDLIIVGGGLAGLTLATEMAACGKSVCLIEKKDYPYHKVCGEYISNEVLHYLQQLGLDPFRFGASSISKLRISTPKGKNIHAPLPLGGFGISRYTLDEEFANLARRKGAQLLTKTTVVDVHFDQELFTVKTKDNLSLTAVLVVGCWGKRDVLDKTLHRSFMDLRTGYMGVKYHIRCDLPKDEIGLDNFENGYSGISAVEGYTYNLCYLRKRNASGDNQSIGSYEENVLHRNPKLREIFKNADFLWEAPVVINEICFAPKPLIENHILMCGDTAGLITPLCGNGMSMAIGSAALLASLIKETPLFSSGPFQQDARHALETAYQIAWNKRYRSRLFWGRTLQSAFGNPHLTGWFLNTVHALPLLERSLIKATHGQPIL